MLFNIDVLNVPLFIRIGLFIIFLHKGISMFIRAHWPYGRVTVKNKHA